MNNEEFLALQKKLPFINFRKALYLVGITPQMVGNWNSHERKITPTKAELIKQGLEKALEVYQEEIKNIRTDK